MLYKALVALALGGSALAQLMIQTPAALTECQPVLISWSGGTAPYFVAVIPGGQPSASALENFPEQNGTSTTWTVDLAAGTSVAFKVTDGTGEINYSQAVTIVPGSSTACVGAGSNNVSPVGAEAASTAAGSSASAASSAPAAAMVSSGSSAMTSASATSSAASSTSHASTSASPSATHSNAAFSAVKVSTGFMLAAAGAVGAAVF